MDKSSSKKQEQSLRDLYPGQNEEWYGRAEANLTEYVGLALRIYERLSRDPKAYSEFKALTREKRLPYDKRSTFTQRSKDNPKQ